MIQAQVETINDRLFKLLESSLTKAEQSLSFGNQVDKAIACIKFSKETLKTMQLMEVYNAKPYIKETTLKEQQEKTVEDKMVDCISTTQAVIDEKNKDKISFLSNFI